MAQRTRIAPRRIQVLHNGLCAELFCPPMPAKAAKAALGFPEESIIITMMARLEPAKNHRMLIEVANQVVRQEPRARFLAVGKGSLMKPLVELASAQGLADKVLFLGQRSDVGEILAATDISVLTSDYEGLPNVIIESMAAGKPIVCTNYQGSEEIMSHESTALISPCGDADAFAEKVLRLIRDISLRNRLSSNAQRYAHEHFSPATMARELEAIYLRFQQTRSEAHNPCRT